MIQLLEETGSTNAECNWFVSSVVAPDGSTNVFSDLPAGGWYELTLRFDDGTTYRTPSRIIRTEWNPEPDLRERLSAGFTWEVTGFGPTGSVVARGGPKRVGASD